MRAEAYQDQETNRHINSAFMIFEVLDDHGKPCTLPRLQPEPLVSWLNSLNHEKRMYVVYLSIYLSVRNPSKPKMLPFIRQITHWLITDMITENLYITCDLLWGCHSGTILFYYDVGF